MSFPIQGSDRPRSMAIKGRLGKVLETAGQTISHHAGFVNPVKTGKVV